MEIDKNIQNTEENFEDLEKNDEIKQLDEKIEIENNIKDFDVDNLILEDGKPLECPHCSWKTHANSKDKKRGLRNHIKKCSNNPKNINSNDSEEAPQQHKKKSKRSLKVNIDKNEKEKEEEIEEIYEDQEAERLKLLNDLDILKVKFESIPFTWSYKPNSSINYLKRQKSLFLRMLNDEAGTQAMFKLLVISSKAVEKVADISNLINLDGYAKDVNEAHEEIYPILKNLVDTGVISVGHLTPELRLGMIMASLAINRMEKNRLMSSNFLQEASEQEDEWQ